MDVFEFFHQLSQRCEDGKCEGCGAREFCYTAPGSVTDDLIQKTIDRMDLTCAADKHCVYPETLNTDNK